MEATPSTIRRETLRLLVLACGGALVLGCGFVLCLRLVLGGETQTWRSQTVGIAARDASTLVTQHLRTAHDIAQAIADRRTLHDLLVKAASDQVFDPLERKQLTDELGLVRADEPDLASLALFASSGERIAMAGPPPLPLTPEPVDIVTLTSHALLLIAIRLPIDGHPPVRLEIAYKLDALQLQFDRERERDHLLRRLLMHDGSDVFGSARSGSPEAQVAIADAPLLVSASVDPARAAEELRRQTVAVLWLLAGLAIGVVVGLGLLLRPIIARINRQSEELSRRHAESTTLAAELRRSNEDLEHFASFASHDLQEPLRMVTAYLGLLERSSGSELTQRSREFLRRAVDGGVRMQEMVAGLLAYARLDRGPDRRLVVDLRALAELACKPLAMRLADEGGSLHLADLGQAFVDPDQLAHVFQNLVGNAIKYRSPERAPVIAIEAVGDQDQVTVSVTDNGRGIAEADRERVFALFERADADRAVPGSGLGLALCRKIIERNRGRIWIESAPVGTIVRFTLPRHATTAPDTHEQGATAHRQRSAPAAR